MRDRRTFAVKRDAAFWSPLWLNAPFHPTELAEKTAPPLPVSKYTKVCAQTRGPTLGQ
jgi:hypothetical protein